MRNVTLIRGARQLLTLRGANGPRRGAELGNLGIIQDGAVLVADGAIIEVGPSRRLENLAIAREAEEIDASGCVVLPGFVACDVRLIGDAYEMSPRALHTLALRAVEEAVRHGVTAIEAKAGPGLTEAAALKILRVHAALRELPLTFVSTLATSDAQLLAIPRLRKLADLAEICGEAALINDADQLGWNVRDADVAVLNPLPAFPRSETHPPERLLDRGDAIALASGANPSAVQMAIALATSTMNMTAAEAITAATINAAHAIGQAQNIGSLETGKSGDLIVLDVPDYRELPYHLGVNIVKLVMIRGTVRVERSEVKWPDR